MNVLLRPPCNSIPFVNNLTGCTSIIAKSPEKIADVVESKQHTTKLCSLRRRCKSQFKDQIDHFSVYIVSKEKGATIL